MKQLSDRDQVARPYRDPEADAIVALGSLLPKCTRDVGAGLVRRLPQRSGHDARTRGDTESLRRPLWTGLRARTGSLPKKS
jgi:hypothetical protein